MSDHSENPFDEDDLEQPGSDVSHPEPAKPAKAGRKSTAGRKRNPVDRAVAKRVIDRFQRITGLNDGERAALASLLDADAANAIELTCRALDGARDASRAVDDIAVLRDLEPTARGVEATVMAMQAKDRFKMAWTVLAPYSALSKDVPAHPSKAGLAFAEAVAGLTDAQLTALRAPLALID